MHSLFTCHVLLISLHRLISVGFTLIILRLQLNTFHAEKGDPDTRPKKYLKLDADAAASVRLIKRLVFTRTASKVSAGFRFVGL